MNWRLVAIATAVAVACFGAGYWKGYSDADKTADLKSVTKQRDALKSSLDDYKATNGRLTEIVKNAKAEEEKNNLAIAGLRGDASRMRGKLTAIVNQYKPGATTGRTSTDKIIGMLAGLLDEAATASDDLAAEAERYRRAGDICERSFDALKRDKK